MDEFTSTLHESRAYWSRLEASRLREAAAALRSSATELCLTSRMIVDESRTLREQRGGGALAPAGVRAA